MKQDTLIMPTANPRRTVQAGMLLLLAPGALWCVGAFYYAFDLSKVMATAATGVTMLLWCAGVVSRRYAPACAAWAVLVLNAIFQTSVLVAYLAISPEQRFDGIAWQQPWRRVLAPIHLADGRFELRNIRDFHYRSERDYDPRYIALTVDPDEISSIDVAFSHWDDLEAVAHSMLGLNFRDGTTVVVSLETRLPAGTGQNALDGFYRRYGLAMLAGTPEDLYGLRADHRGEALFIYRLDLEPETQRKMVRSLFSRAARMRVKPEFYNSLCRNCTTGLLPMLPGADELLEGDFRIIMNGLADKLLFEKGLLCRRDGERFDSLRSRCLVPGRAAGTGAPRETYRGTSEARFLKKR